jgi:Reverse transcriptase (RNA-dependent DNA polymerase)
MPNSIPDMPQAPRRSNQAPQPSAAGAAMKNIPYTSCTEKTVQDIKSASDRIRSDRMNRHRTNLHMDLMGDFTLAGIVHEEEDPKSITEALSCQNGQKWFESLQSELKSMKDHHIWDLIPRKTIPIGKKVIKSKTICHIKRDENGHIAKLKTRIITKGFTQITGEDYHDTFLPVARLESFCLILAIATTLDWELRQLNMKTAFLHAKLKEEIYMEQPEGGIVKGYKDHICRLHKGIYGLKQASRQWNKKLNKAMCKHKFNHISADHCIYTRTTSQGKSMVAIHTDDITVISKLFTIWENL